jgi:hypothetical protein
MYVFGGTEMNGWREAEIITDSATIGALDHANQNVNGRPLPCHMCAEQQLRKAKSLVERGVVREDASLVIEPPNYYVVAMLVFDRETWCVCLDHLYQFVTDTDAIGVQKGPRRWLIRRDQRIER